PGGVSSPVRAFAAVGGTPRFIERGAGAWVTDADGNRLLDLVLSWGPLIAGHAHPRIVKAATSAMARGSSFGASCELEVRLAEQIIAAMPAVEMIRFVSSGTEAVMSAVRLARAATGRRGILKFEGCYHGHSDALLASAGSGVATLSLPDSPGVLAATVADTHLAPYNDLDAVTGIFHAFSDEIAAVLVEPVAGNMGVVPPAPGFLEGLRQVTVEHGALLIFDEVMTGWRVHPGGAQALYGVEPDLTTLGKVMGGGFPAAAYGGHRALMELVAPEGAVYQAGTLSGNPVAMAAGLATLELISEPGVWARAEAWAQDAAAVLEGEALRSGVPLTVQRVGTMFTPFFTDAPIRNFSDARGANRVAFARFFHAMLGAGVYLPPSPLEASFSSTVHDDDALEHFERAARSAFPC
ncbi:MAG TPA: glutamate-1-semialdehyde 2,1-aminomutase, partial [Gemmatimonadales bacterium]|nr:glutamate-1-semialdehyde 2,1-aminomutase [Gemmatimonadales bacterium]